MAAGRQTWILAGDLLGRAGVTGYFAYSAFEKIAVIYVGLKRWPTLDLDQKELWLLSQIAVLLFLVVVVANTIFRLQPVRSSQGLESRLTALAGTFLLGTLAYLPASTDLSPILTGLATMLVIIGSFLSIYVLHWLGQSFSIMAEARRLVTCGPYAHVRHPLYLTEEVACIGVILLHFSPLAVAIGVVHWLLQMRRMRNEERVLSLAFPDYLTYAAMTPRVIPQALPLFGKSA